MPRLKQYPFRAISFDFWCTLFALDRGLERRQIRIDALTRQTGLPKDDVAAAVRAATEELNRIHQEEHRTLGPDEAVRIASQKLGISLEPKAFDRIVEVFATAIVECPPPPVEGALQAVRKAAEQFPIGICSDTSISTGASLRILLDRQGFLPHFKTLIFSDEAKASKPDPAVFQSLAQGLGVETRHILHIGDLEYTDIDGAHAVGAQAALFTGVNPQFAQTTKADYTFNTWQDLTTLLENPN
jgi:FMN phosphatase YigB (HAD superfamily)